MDERVDFSKIIAISNRHLCRRPFLEQVERALSYHPKAFLLREKDLSKEEYLKLAEKVKKLCDHYQVPLIPHFYPEAAQMLKIQIVHLPLWKFQEVSGTWKGRVGVSIHSTEDVKLAQELGAAYLTAGHIFATDCKKGLAPRGLSFLREICEKGSVPVYGIGGIRLDPLQIKTVLDQGANGVCIMSEMMKI